MGAAHRPAFCARSLRIYQRLMMSMGAAQSRRLNGETTAGVLGEIDEG